MKEKIPFSFAEHAVDNLPVGRVGAVEEIANLACYLLSDYSSWMTGEVKRILT